MSGLHEGGRNPEARVQYRCRRFGSVNHRSRGRSLVHVSPESLTVLPLVLLSIALRILVCVSAFDEACISGEICSLEFIISMERRACGGPQGVLATTSRLQPTISNLEVFVPHESACNAALNKFCDSKITC